MAASGLRSRQRRSRAKNRAIERRALWAADNAARELPNLPLEDALPQRRATSTPPFCGDRLPYPAADMYLHEPVAEEHLRPHGRICDPLGALLRKELALLAENGNEPIRVVGCERGRPHWPAGASFSRTSMEHLARNDFITLERQGTTWTFGLGSRVEQMASQSGVGSVGVPAHRASMNVLHGTSTTVPGARSR